VTPPSGADRRLRPCWLRHPRKADGTADITVIVRDVPLNDLRVIYQNKRDRVLRNKRFGARDIPLIGDKGRFYGLVPASGTVLWD
jgi:hypothetical protein